MATQLLNTLHIHADDVPFVEVMPGLEIRVLHARPDEHFVVTEFRGAPGCRSGLHRHVTPAYAFTSAGQWGHDEEFEYHTGSYIFETPGDIHQYLNGPEAAQVYFLDTGDTELIDEGTLEVTGIMGLADKVDRYFEACEQAGLSRPNILR
jgi:quercetin dioxygenase-like cupin family protein